VIEGENEDDQPGKSKSSKVKKGKTPAAKRWSVDQVSEWLKGLKLDEFVKPLQKEQVDGRTLLTLEDEDLEETGASRLRRKKLLANIDKLREE